MLQYLKLLYGRLVQSGVDKSTPAHLIDRVVLSNLICLVGSGVNLYIAAVNLSRGFYLLLMLNGAYQASMIACIYLNSRKKYFAGRMIFLATIYIGMFVTGLIQGPALEVEHFFIPFGMFAFTLFYAEERKFSLGLLLLAVFFYVFLIVQPGPLWPIDKEIARYSAADLQANRVAYLALFVASLVGMSKAFDRALKVINEQRARLFEEERLAAFGLMVGNVAHEVNSPLAALDLQLYQLEALLRKTHLTPEQMQERITRMRAVTRRISVIVRGLKFLSGENSSDAPAKASVGGLIESALDLVRDRLEREGIKLLVNVEDSAEEITCRPVALSQVFLNLINNSVDAVQDLPQEKRWIKMEAARSGEHLVASITDGGAIASPEARENLFKNFFTTKAPGKGTGLGLSISRKTVSAHQGKLYFDPGSANTKFVLELPLDRGPL